MEERAVFPFEFLCAEMKDHVFKFLPLSALKNVRLVSSSCNAISSRYIGFKNPILNDSSISTISNTNQVFSELTISLLRSKAENFNPGQYVRKIMLKHTCHLYGEQRQQGLDSLNWIIESCPNLEELQIMECQCQLSLFGKYIWSNEKSMGLCKNLKKLKVYVIPEDSSSFKLVKWNFDCAFLNVCTKLEEVDIVSTSSFSLKNASKLLKSLKKFSALLLLGENFTIPELEGTLESLCTQFGVEKSQSREPSSDIAIQIRKILTTEYRVAKICSNEENAADILDAFRQLEFGDRRAYFRAIKPADALLYFANKFQ